MTDETINLEEIATEVENLDQEQPPTSDTAFIIVREFDGGWRVITDMTVAFTIARDASRADVKLGISELNRFLNNDELVNMLLTKLSEGNRPESQVTSEAMRQALQDRNLL
jgi:hemerythrin superfamily protein